jgi:hypothetical protein
MSFGDSPIASEWVESKLATSSSLWNRAAAPHDE